MSLSSREQHTDHDAQGSRPPSRGSSPRALRFFRHTVPAMARRSIGVVLVVALVSWTVNWLTLECQSQHSRAAVVVPAGASPAYKPEPSPSRHTCCPQVKSQPSFHDCSLVLASLPDCCSFHHNRNARPPRLLITGPAIAHASPQAQPASAQSLSEASPLFAAWLEAPAPVSSIAVLRL